jgi:pimeloyl-ACP methyl ester carboxylesterase
MPTIKLLRVMVPVSMAVLAVGIAVAGARDDEAPPNIPMATLGGLQFWSDTYLHAGWRIQTNLISGHSRLLDPDNIRRAWGSYEATKTAFDSIRRREGIVPAGPHLVLMIHGVARSTGTFSKMREALSEAGYDAAPIGYASTRRSLEEHAEGLEVLLNRLEGTETVSFVTHSMGGLVLRHLLARDGDWKRRVKVGRIVMIAPPNQGSAIARWLADFPPYTAIYGKSGQQLTPAAASAVPALDLPFGIIAGGRKDGEGFNPFLAGDDDGTLAVTETQLAGASGFLIVPAIHGRISNHPETIRATLNFLKFGRFEASP